MIKLTGKNIQKKLSAFDDILTENFDWLTLNWIYQFTLLKKIAFSKTIIAKKNSDKWWTHSSGWTKTKWLLSIDFLMDNNFKTFLKVLIACMRVCRFDCRGKYDPMFTECQMILNISLTLFLQIKDHYILAHLTNYKRKEEREKLIEERREREQKEKW